MEISKATTEELKKRLAFLEREAKEYDVKQKAVKVIANALYGVSAAPFFSYYDPDLAEAITLTGQYSLKLMRKATDEYLNNVLGTKGVQYVVYQDTDSGYIHVQELVNQKCKNMNDQEIVNFLEEFVESKLQPLYDEVFKDTLPEFGVEDCKLFYKLECIGPSAIWTAPKKYAFNILYSEGVRYETPKTKIMGIEIVRSSTPTMVKPHLKKCIEIMLSGEESDLQRYVIDVKKDFFNQPYWEISFPRGVNGLKTYSSSQTIYQKGNGVSTPIAVRGALLYNYHIEKNQIDNKYPPIGEGDKCKFVYIKKPNPIHENVIAFPSKIPKELGLEKYVDYNIQWEKTFLSPLDKLLTAVGWSAEPKNTAFDECW